MGAERIQTFSSSSKWIRSTCNAFIILKIINEKKAFPLVIYAYCRILHTAENRQRTRNEMEWLLINLTKRICYTVDTYQSIEFSIIR